MTSNRTVHIKIADRGWILEKCASEIAKRSDFVTFGTHDDSSATLQYYVNYSCRSEKVVDLEAAFFTHSEIDGRARERFFTTAREVDACVCMSKRYADELKHSDVRNIVTISPGVDLSLFRSKLRIGVVGRTYHTGRKGESLVAQVMDVPGIEWRFTGSGWPGSTSHVSDGNLPHFYNSLDYLLIPSLYEGGPMSALESLACGVPVISSDVGWMDSYPHIPFENGNASSLRQVLQQLVAKRDELRESVKEVTWERWADEHLELFDRMISQHSRPLKVKAIQADGPSSIAIISHGGEKIAKGGPTTRIGNIVRTASDRGVDIEVVAKVGDRTSGLAHVFNSWPLEFAPTELRQAKQNGLTTVYSPIALNLQYHDYYALAVPELLRKCANSAQLDEGVKAVQRLTTPFSIDDKTPPAEGLKGHFAALRTGVGLADHVIFLSDYERMFLSSIGAEPKQASVIRNGVDAAMMAEGSASAFQNTYGLSDFVLLVGRIETRKNQALVAYALRDIDRPVVCVGHIGDPKYFQLMKQWIGPNFVHIERIEERSTLAGLYKSAACLVLASWAEGAPLVAIEAAAAGTPLVLSKMSGEREYFGDSAGYVHPCDLNGIRSAVADAIDKGRDVSARKSNSLKFAARFDISKHTQETVSLYESIRQSTKPTFAGKARKTKIVLDNTHLTHHLAKTRVLTGVTHVEYNISNAIREIAPDISSVVWTGSFRSHVETSLDTILTATNPLNTIVESKKLEDQRFVRLARVEIRVPPKRHKLTVSRAAMSAFKQGLAALPSAINRPAIAAIRAVKPNFQPDVLPEHRLFGFDKQTKIAISPHFEPVPSAHANSLNAGDRLILLGQPWISNDTMLEDLCSLVRERGVKLWAHVPDIVYVTDPDSFDDQTRHAYRRRLDKLLSVTDTAIVISDQAEADIRQFAATHSHNIKTKRIRLSINHGLRLHDAAQPAKTPPKRFVMYVSSINNRKRHSFLIDVWKDVRRAIGPSFQDVALLFVGSPQAGYAKYRDQNFLQQLQTENIFVWEDLTDREVAWLYQRCLFTTYPARIEGWGIPPIESLFFGKPCVVTSTLPVATETDNGALIKLEANDYFSWVNMIASLITNTSMLNRLSTLATTLETPSWAESASILLHDGRQ